MQPAFQQQGQTRQRRFGPMPEVTRQAFQDPIVSGHIRKLRGQLAEARAGQRRSQGSVRSDLNKFIMPKLVQLHPQLQAAKAQTTSQQGRVGYMRLYNAALSTLTNQIINSNWNNILTLDKDKERDAKLQQKYGSNMSELLKARKAAHRVSIQRWWMFNKARMLQTIDNIVSQNPDSALGWISSAPQLSVSAAPFVPASTSSSSSSSSSSTVVPVQGPISGPVTQ